jgi:hypothetical protein
LIDLLTYLLLVVNEYIKVTIIFNGILVAQYKACFKIRCLRQTIGIDYEKNCSPSYFQLISLHVFIALVAINNYHIHQMDVTIAFLYGKLRKVIYIEQPS